MNLQDGSDGKESACNAGDPCSIPGLGRSPGRWHDNPLQYSCLENPLGQRSLAGNSPWGCKELDMTERLSTAHSTGELSTIPLSNIAPKRYFVGCFVSLITSSSELGMPQICYLFYMIYVCLCITYKNSKKCSSPKKPFLLTWEIHYPHFKCMFLNNLLVFENRRRIVWLFKL